MFIVFTPYTYFNGQTYGGAVSYADVTSANTVGFQTMETVAGGYCMLTPTFEGITEKAIGLQQIKLTGEYASGYGNEQIQLLNEGGSVTTTYTWADPLITGYPEACWVDESFAPVDGVSFKTGDSFIIFTGDGSCNLTWSGQVKFSATELTTVAGGYIGLGNGSPVAFDVQKIKMSGEFAAGYGNEQIQILNEAGSVTTTFTWADPLITGYPEACWVDESFAPVEFNVQPGFGFIVYTGDGECTLTIPAVK